MDLNKIAVVILNYNGAHLLKEYLPTVIKYSKEANIYVIDNASTDQSIEYLQMVPEVKTIKLSSNLGYAGGYNEGLKSVKEPFLCLLNSDVKVTENWLKPILDEFGSKTDVSIIQPKILDLKNPEVFEYAGAAGGYMDKFGYPYCRGRIFDTVEKDNNQYDDRQVIFWASGACLFIKNEVFKSLGGFDDRFFAHMEEIDLCWRAFNKNHKAIYLSNSVIFHLGGGTLTYQTTNKTFLNFRNSLYTITKNVGKGYFNILMSRLILDGVAAAKFLFQLKPNHTLAILKAHLSFYRHYKDFRKSSNWTSSKTNYYDTKSVVWSYFIRGCKKFDCL